MVSQALLLCVTLSSFCFPHMQSVNACAYVMLHAKGSPAVVMLFTLQSELLHNTQRSAYYKDQIVRFVSSTKVITYISRSNSFCSTQWEQRSDRSFPPILARPAFPSTELPVCLQWPGHASCSCFSLSAVTMVTGPCVPVVIETVFSSIQFVQVMEMMSNIKSPSTSISECDVSFLHKFLS